MANIFITGTDTGVGKTVTAAILARELGFHYWKPIQSGLEGKTDSEIVSLIIGKKKIISEVYKLSKPLSPHLASKIDGISLSIKKIFSIYQSIQYPTVIEGAGGLLVPLNKKEFMIDLISKLKCPCILVARAGLGTINHTLLSLKALREKQIEPLGVIVNGPRNLENEKAILYYGKTKILAHIPELKGNFREYSINT